MSQSFGDQIFPNIDSTNASKNMPGMPIRKMITEIHVRMVEGFPERARIIERPKQVHNAKSK